MAEMQSNNKVLIIGAGLGGLVLANVLLKHGVPFEIFERDESHGTRKQGWAVALNDSVPSLLELLPERLAKDLPSNSVNINTGDLDEIGVANAKTGEKVGAVGGKPFGTPGSILRVGRERFRSFLWSTLEVKTGKHFKHYVQDDTGVTAHFADGSTACGSILIGADGAHSHVLDQLIGRENHEPKISNIVPVFGEVDLPPPLYEPVREMANAVLLATDPGTGVRIQLGMMTMNEDKSSAHYFWAVTLKREAPKELSDWIQKAKKQELFSLVAESMGSFHPAIKDAVLYGGPESIVEQARFLEFEPPESMPEGRVSILGDAAHTMIPLRAGGANTAITDACDLGRLLLQANAEGRDFSSVLPVYNEVMIPRGRQMVRSSHEAGEMDGELWAEMVRR